MMRQTVYDHHHENIQKNIEIQRKNDPAWIKKPSKKQQKSVKNRSKIGPWALPGRSWGQLGDHLGPKSSQDAFGSPKCISLDPPPPKMEPC